MTTRETPQNNTASVTPRKNTAKRPVPLTVALQSLPGGRYVFRSNSNNFVINSDKSNIVYQTTEHIRDLVSNQRSRVRVCRDNFTFRTTEQLNCVNLCYAVCHRLCYSYSQSVATFSTLIAPSIQRTILTSYSKSIIQCVCFAIFTCC